MSLLRSTSKRNPTEDYSAVNQDSNDHKVDAAEEVPDAEPPQDGTVFIKEHFEEFCGRTSMHGFSYLAERRTVDRICWFLAVILSAVWATIYISNECSKWESALDIVILPDTAIPTHDYPFPAVTICSENKVKDTELNITDLFIRNFTEPLLEEEMEKLRHVSLICEGNLVNGFDFLKPHKQPNCTSLKYIAKVAPQLDDVISLCSLKNIMIPCSKLFYPVLTDVGLCYTFNMLNTEDMFTKEAFEVNGNLTSHGRGTLWNVESGYSRLENKDQWGDLFVLPNNENVSGNGDRGEENVEGEDTTEVELSEGLYRKTSFWNLYFFDEIFDETTYPYRTKVAGVEGGISFQVNSDPALHSYGCHIPVQGVKVLLHNPAVFPEMKRKSSKVPQDQDVMIVVRPNIVTTDFEMDGYRWDFRQCYKPAERKLRFFSIYTQANCYMECRAEFTLDQCGCVPFYLPRMKDVPLCARNVCDLERLPAEEEDDPACDCEPSCEELEYNMDMSQAPSGLQQARLISEEIQRRNPNKQLPENDLVGKSATGRISVYYKEVYTTTSRRTEYGSKSDIIANIGGFLGLFLGFSVLSIFEVLYFLTLRLGYKLYGPGGRFRKTADSETSPIKSEALPTAVTPV